MGVETRTEQLDLALAGEFPRATREQWLAEAYKVLGRGSPDATAEDLEKRFRRVLVTHTYDGLDISPLYDLDDPRSDPGLPGQAPFVRGRTAAGATAGGWEVCQRLEVGPDGRPAGAAVAELEGGANSLWLGLETAPSVDSSALSRVLSDVLLDLVSVRLDAGGRTEEASDALVALWEEQQVPGGAARATLGFDPIGRAASDGTFGAELDRATGDAVACTKRIVASYPQLKALVADGIVYQRSGASDAQELGCALATGVAYLRRLVDAGLGVDQAFRLLEVRLAATADQFSTIAKLRASRRLWARVAEVLGSDAAPPSQHAVTSAAMLSVYDPWVNLLRTSVACFAAGVGGADAVTVLPFDTYSAGTASSDLGRRLARNIQALLLEETQLSRVIDLAGGSWYVESLTSALADQGWTWFQEIEAGGGVESALASGLVQQRLDSTWQARAKRLASGADPLTGVSEFPNVAEPIPVGAAHLPDPDPDADPEETAPGLPLRRYPAAFEALRARTDRAVGAGRARPSVFLATLGSASAFTARLTFAQNLFGIAGITATSSSGESSPAALAAEFQASGARLACLCSSDPLYAEQAEEAARALKDAGVGRLYLAGRPGSHQEAWEGAGIDEFVFVGADRLKILDRALDEAGVAR
jgi:methylmalonyl-CoA mutase